MPNTRISTVSYNATTGLLTLTGANLATAASSFNVTDFTVTGDKANSFTLTSTSLVATSSTASKLLIQLSAADQLALDGLLNKNGSQANDGQTTYNLALSSGWETSAAAITPVKVTVSNVQAPTISAVSYNAVTDQLSFTGSHLTAYGTSSGINIADFKIAAGASAYTLTDSADVLSNFKATGFVLTLNGSDQAVVSSLLNANGVHNSAGSAYKLSATKDWDGGSGAAITATAVTVSGVPTLSKVAWNATSGVLTLSGANLTTALSSYTLSDFTFKGDSGQTYTLSGVASLSGTPGASTISFQLNASDLLGLDTMLDKNGLQANDAKTNYSLSALAQWDSGAAALATLPVTVSNVITPSITAISYNASTGVFSLAGANFLDHSDSYHFNLSDFKISAGSSSYSFNNTTDSLSSLSANSFNITLGSADRALVDAFVNADGLKSAAGSVYSLSAATHWDNNSATSVTGKAVSVSAVPTLSTVSYNAATGILQLAGSNLGTVNVSDLSLKGDALVSYTLSAQSEVVGTANASAVSILLSAADQLAVNGLLNNNGGTASDGDSYQLTPHSGWLTGAAITTQAITVSNQTPPTLSTVSYNAADGVLTVTGGNLENHGSGSGPNLSDFTLSAGSSSYSFNSTDDKVSNLTASGFTITLDSAAQASVNSFINADGDSAQSGTAYNLKTTANWDSDNGAAISSQAVTASNVAFANTLYTVISTGLYAPAGLAVDSAGDLLIADMYDNAVKELATGGTTLTALLTTGLNLPAAVRIDSLGDIYIADSNGNAIQEIQAGSDNVLSIMATGLINPSSIAIDSSGDLFIADSGNNAIKEIVAGTSTVETLVSAGLNFPGDIVTDSQGNLYILDSGNNAVKELAVGSHTLTTVLSTGLNDPGAIAIDQYGNLYIDDTTGGDIKEIVAGSHAVITLLTTGLNDSEGLAVDSLGNLYIADSGSGSLMEVSLNALPEVLSVSYDAATGILTLNGQNLISGSNGLVATDLSILGDQGGKYTLGTSSTVIASGTSTAISLQLSAADQLGVDVLLNSNGTLAADGTSSFLLAVSNGWDGSAPIFNSQPITVADFIAPAINTVNFNAATGEFDFIGSNLLAHSSSAALVVKDFMFTVGSQSFSFGAADTLNNFSASGYTITLGAADLQKVKTFIDDNGATSIAGTAYNLSASAEWDGDSSSVISTQAVNAYNVVNPVSVSSVGYNVATGVLTLNGGNLSTSAAAYGLNDLLIKGYDGGSYSLSSSSVAAASTASKLSIQLSAADQLAVDGLLNKNGGQAADGQTSYSLSAANGWLANSMALSSTAISVSNVAAPEISAVSYNAATGILSFSGSNLIADGSLNGITLNHISLSNGAGGSYTVNSLADSISQFSATGFSIQLGGADQATVNNLFAGNGNSLNRGQAYTLSITAAWDSGLGAALSKQTLTVSNAELSTVLGSGLAFADGATTDSKGDEFVADSGNNTIKELVAGSNTLITLVSTGLNDPTALAIDSSGNLYIADSGDNAIKEISDTALVGPVLTAISYNAANGELTLSGNQLDTLSSHYLVTDLTLSGYASASYTLGSGTTLVGAATATGLTLQLSASDQLAVDGLLNNNGATAIDGSAYSLQAASGWDAGANAQQVSNISVSNVTQPVITAISYDPASGVFTVSGDNLNSTGLNASINLHDFSLTSARASYSFNASKDSISQLSATGFDITLSSADLTTLNNDLKINGAPQSPASDDFSASSGWDSGIGSAISSQSISIAAPQLDALTTASIVTATNIPASTFISSQSDTNNLTISTYAFRNDGDQGYFVLNGVKQGNGNWITVSAANLAGLDFIGSGAGTENIDIAIDNGLAWSSIATTSVTTLIHAPILSQLSQLSNPGIFAEVGKELVGNSLSFNGMLAILQSVAANGAVTASEFRDLQTLVAHFVTSGGSALASDQIQVSPYVYDISNKLINGDSANAYWTGGGSISVALGNLAVGSTQLQLNELIGKWFLGTDLPIPTLDDATTGGTQTGVYTNLNALPLYGSSGVPQINDINQNQLGDCYFLAALGEVAKYDPAAIKSMITNNGNNTWGIRFYVEGVATYITVNDELPESGGVLLANQSSNLWAELIEKAYVQLNAVAGDTGHNAGNQWNLIDGGWADPLAQITDQTIAGYDSYLQNSANTTAYANTAWSAFKATIVSAINDGEAVLYASNGDASANGKITFISSHMFMVTGYDTKTGDFILQNPWGAVKGQTWDTTFEASMSQLQTVGEGSIFVGLTGSTTASLANIYVPVIGTNADSTASVAPGAAAVVNISNLVEGSGQIALQTSQFTAFAGLSTLNADNLSNADQSTGSKDYLYYNASSGGLYYDAHPAQSATGTEIAVVGVNSHPDALTLADFRLI